MTSTRGKHRDVIGVTDRRRRIRAQLTAEELGRFFFFYVEFTLKCNHVTRNSHRRDEIHIHSFCQNMQERHFLGEDNIKMGFRLIQNESVDWIGLAEDR